ncbi:MAG: hypothetical protein ACQETX_12630 [Pseudomonadota bacterium]
MREKWQKQMPLMTHIKEIHPGNARMVLHIAPGLSPAFSNTLMIFCNFFNPPKSQTHPPPSLPLSFLALKRVFLYIPVQTIHILLLKALPQGPL